MHNEMILGGVMISTESDRFDAMRTFYVDVLDLIPRSDRPGFVNFDLGQGRLTIAVHSEVHGGTVEPARMMINLMVDSVAAMFESCMRRGASMIRPPQRERWGGVVATLNDPDGNLVQLLSTN